jgi:hypothetical protein
MCVCVYDDAYSYIFNSKLSEMRFLVQLLLLLLLYDKHQRKKVSKAFYFVCLFLLNFNGMAKIEKLKKKKILNIAFILLRINIDHSSSLY